MSAGLGGAVAAAGGPIGVGLGVAGLALPFLARPRRKKVDYQKVVNKWRAMRPQGQIYAEDRAYAERNLNRAKSAIGGQLASGRAAAVSNLAARGLEGGGLATRALAGLNAQAGQQGEDATNASLDSLDQLRLSREGYDRELIASGLRAELGSAQQQQSDSRMQESEFWNSALQYIPSISKLFVPQAPTQPGGTVPGGSQTRAPGGRLGRPGALSWNGGQPSLPYAPRGSTIGRRTRGNGIAQFGYQYQPAF